MTRKVDSVDYRERASYISGAKLTGTLIPGPERGPCDPDSVGGALKQGSPAQPFLTTKYSSKITLYI